MADTYTTAGKVRLIEDGTRSATWGPTLNTDTLELLADFAGGISNINIGVSTTYALAALSNGTDSESRAAYIKISGTPASAVTATVPASVVDKLYRVDNQTGQALTIGYAAGANVTLPVGVAAFVWCDGSTVVLVSAYLSGSFTGTLTGCTTSPTGTILYSINGDIVTLHVPAITGTSNTTAATITGLPNAICPVATRIVPGIISDNGIEKIGLWSISSAGTITLYNASGGALSTTFTNSGTKGIGLACSASFKLTN
jgi:hypothetical protein